jgi:hypothetical protein
MNLKRNSVSSVGSCEEVLSDEGFSLDTRPSTLCFRYFTTAFSSLTPARTRRTA